MAFLFDTNSIPTTDAVCIYKLLALLISQTWTKPKDSDGTTFSATGVQITGGNAGANGLGNTNAWFVVQYPGGGRSFCFQRGANNAVWRVKYSKSAGFVGGTPSASQVPSATDEVTLIGAGTDASPTFQNFFGAGTDGVLRCNCFAGDTSVGYSFYFDAFPAGNANTSHYTLYMDFMAPGTFPAADTDPVVVYMTGPNGASQAWGTDLTNTITQAHAYLNTTWQGVSGLIYNYTGGNNAGFPAIVGAGVGTNPFAAKDDLVPIPYGRTFISGGQIGFKGFSSILRWNGTVRANGDTISTTGVGSRDFFYINGNCMPWDGSIPSL